ncbi:hypothetical protein N657DRAFT_280917 [Parathielavia appendiculata]|uniref:Uncharacterized protein n=1 Tax=Parathielavia appendiculata TaxID=2587402 RepID=A0AAN6Z5D1_9PEZI|nr:hypothetical protein N657DRAFT_280917 [Parathielavia appendiculata]
MTNRFCDKMCWGRHLNYYGCLRTEVRVTGLRTRTLIVPRQIHYSPFHWWCSRSLCSFASALVRSPALHQRLFQRRVSPAAVPEYPISPTPPARPRMADRDDASDWLGNSGIRRASLLHGRLPHPSLRLQRTRSCRHSIHQISTCPPLMVMVL